MADKNGDLQSGSIASLSHAYGESMVEGDEFYLYGDAIVQRVEDSMSGNIRLKPLTIARLKCDLRRTFVGQPDHKFCSVAEDILNSDLPLKCIRGLVTTPAFREDLSLITEPGFDSASGLYYAPDPSLQDFVFNTRADRSTAEAALKLLMELLTDFPFIESAQRKGQFAYLSTLLTLFLRSSIRAVVPCLAIDGNGQSVGKGLLSSMLSWIPYGQDAASMSAPKSREEWASKLDSILLDGKPFQVIDNIVGAFSSDDFASVLTSMRRSIRIKGLSKVVDVPVNTVWVLNGNSVGLDADLAQRVIMCHLQHPDASSRQQDNFHIQKKYGCSIEMLLRNKRSKYLQACLDIICAWVSAGAPRRKKPVMAKYGEWESVIGGIIDWIAPEACFLSDHLKDTLSVDSEKDEAITFLKQLMIAFPNCGTRAIGVSEIAERTFSTEERSNLRDFVPEGLMFGKSFAKKLGHWLKNAATRRWGSIELIAEKNEHENVWKYRIGEGIKTKRDYQKTFDEAIGCT